MKLRFRCNYTIKNCAIYCSHIVPFLSSGCMQDIEEDEDWGPTIFDESEEGELIDDV